MIKKLILSGSILLWCTSCSQFSLLASGGSLALSQNSYAKMYNTVDMLTIMGTKKSIKEQIYEKGKTYIYDGTVGLVRRPR